MAHTVIPPHLIVDFCALRPPVKGTRQTKQTRARANMGTARTNKGLGVWSPGKWVMRPQGEPLLSCARGDEVPQISFLMCVGRKMDVRGWSVVSRPETQYSPVCSISCLDTSPAGIQARPVSTLARLLLRSQKTDHISRITLPLQCPAK